MFSKRFLIAAASLLVLVIVSCPGWAESRLVERSLEKLDAAPPSSPDCFEFIVVADSNSLKPLEQPEVFRQCVREFNILRPNLVVHSGDMILGGAAEGLPPQWDLFDEVIEACEPPFFPLPGNHDITDPASEQLWLDRIGPTHYTFTYGNSLFILLNTEEQGAVQRISDEQAAWARQQLEASEAENVFVFLHRPYFTHPGDPDEAATLWDKHWSNMAEVFRGHPVRGVFAGHVHNYRDCGIRDGVRYTICGGASVYGMNGPEEEGNFNHYLLVRVRGTDVTWSVIKPGAVLPDDAVTSARMDELYNIRNTWIQADELFVPLGSAVDESLNITVVNPHDAPMKSTLTWDTKPGWRVSPMETEYEVPGKGSVDLAFRVATERPEDARFPVPFFSTRYEQTQHGPAVEVRQDLKLVLTASVVRAPNSVQIDGVLEDWGEARMARLIYPSGFDGKDKTDLDSELGFMWDDDWLYLAVSTQDNEYHQPYAGDIVWSADNVETFLGGWSWGLTLTKDGPEVFMYWGVDAAGQEVNTDVKLAVKREGTRMTYEAAFPRSLLTPLELASGSSFRFNTLMNDLDPSGPEESRHWLQLVPEYSAEGGPKPRMKFVLEE
jgi:Calcineurin-like phosphoesterase/Carbohydrate family 9 binding domain-like